MDLSEEDLQVTCRMESLGNRRRLMERVARLHAPEPPVDATLQASIPEAARAAALATLSACSPYVVPLVPVGRLNALIGRTRGVPPAAQGVRSAPSECAE